MEVEGLKEKIKILQNSLDNYAKTLDMKERIIADLNNDNSNLRNKNRRFFLLHSVHHKRTYLK